MNDFLKVLRVQWDRAGAIFSVVLGALCLLLGYLGVSDTPYVAAQLPYFISGGLVGIFFLGVGGILWISADMRDEWRELRALRLAIQPDLQEGVRPLPDQDQDFGAALPEGELREATDEAPPQPQAKSARRRPIVSPGPVATAADAESDGAVTAAGSGSARLPARARRTPSAGRASSPSVNGA